MNRIAVVAAVLLGVACGPVSPGLDAGMATGGGVSGVGGGNVGGGNVGGGNVGGGNVGGGGGFNPCRGLSVGACRANPLCAPDFCFACSCRPNFEQCRLVREAPAVCPSFGCLQPQCCASDATCGRPLICMEPNRPTCGACNNAPSTCADDAACNTATTGNICLPRPCACSGQTDCQPGCSTQNPCGDGQTCDPVTRRCEQTRCASTPCPSGFNCVLGPTGNVCVARACTSDRDCGDIFCVSGTCRTSLGVCGQFMP